MKLAAAVVELAQDAMELAPPHHGDHEEEEDARRNEQDPRDASACIFAHIGLLFPSDKNWEVELGAVGDEVFFFNLAKNTRLGEYIWELLGICSYIQPMHNNIRIKKLYDIL